MYEYKLTVSCCYPEQEYNLMKKEINNYKGSPSSLKNVFISNHYDEDKLMFINFDFVEGKLAKHYLITLSYKYNENYTQTCLSLEDLISMVQKQFKQFVKMHSRETVVTESPQDNNAKINYKGYQIEKGVDYYAIIHEHRYYPFAKLKSAKRAIDNIQIKPLIKYVGFNEELWKTIQIMTIKGAPC